MSASLHDVIDTYISQNVPCGQWDLSAFSNLDNAFQNHPDFNDPSIVDLNVGHVVSMNGMFKNCYKFNHDLSGWNVGPNLASTAGMFEGCDNLNSPLLWKDKKTTSLFNCENMFIDCTKLNQPVELMFYPSNTNDKFNFHRMFFYCINLEIPVIIEFANNDDNAILYIYSSRMFGSCRKLREFDNNIAKQNVSNSSEMNDMFNQTEITFPDIVGEVVVAIFMNHGYMLQNANGYDLIVQAKTPSTMNIIKASPTQIGFISFGSQSTDDEFRHSLDRNLPALLRLALNIVNKSDSPNKLCRIIANTLKPIDQLEYLKSVPDLMDPETNPAAYQQARQTVQYFEQNDQVKNVISCFPANSLFFNKAFQFEHDYKDDTFDMERRARFYTTDNRSLGISKFLKTIGRYTPIIYLSTLYNVFAEFGCKFFVMFDLSCSTLQQPNSVELVNPFDILDEVKTKYAGQTLYGGNTRRKTKRIGKKKRKTTQKRQIYKT